MKKKIALGILMFIVTGFLVPQNLKMPVAGAGNNSYNHETFWYGGWGRRWYTKVLTSSPGKAQVYILLPGELFLAQWS